MQVDNPVPVLGSPPPVHTANQKPQTTGPSASRDSLLWSISRICHVTDDLVPRTRKIQARSLPSPASSCLNL